jgi:hypothetical protein
MKNELDFLYLRGALFNNKYHEHVKKVFDETYQELLNRKNKEKYNSGIVNFMLVMMDMAKKELEDDNLLLAGYDINILHNLPETIYNKWDKCYFFQSELLGYCDNMLELDRADKVKSIIHNTYEYLSPIYENTQAMKE